MSDYDGEEPWRYYCSPQRCWRCCAPNPCFNVNRDQTRVSPSTTHNPTSYSSRSRLALPATLTSPDTAATWRDSLQQDGQPQQSPWGVPTLSVPTHVPFSQLLNLDDHELKRRIGDVALLSDILAYKRGIQFLPETARLPRSPISIYSGTADRVSDYTGNRSSLTNDFSPAQWSKSENGFSTDESLLDALVTLQRHDNRNHDPAGSVLSSSAATSFDHRTLQRFLEVSREEEKSDTAISRAMGVGTNRTVFTFPITHTNEPQEDLPPVPFFGANFSHVRMSLHPSINGVEEDFVQVSEEEPLAFLESIAKPEALPFKAPLDADERVIAQGENDNKVQMEISSLSLRSQRIFKSNVVSRVTRPSPTASSTDVNISWRSVGKSSASQTLQQPPLTLVPTKNNVLEFVRQPKQLRGKSRKRSFPFHDTSLVGRPATRGEKQAKLHLEQALRFKDQLTY